MGQDRPLGSVPEPAGRAWYGVRETAAMLGVTRQTVHERVRKLQGAELVGGRWRIPAPVVEALLTAERAKALASGTLVVLPGGARRDEPAVTAGVGDLAELADRVAGLERSVREQSEAFAQQLSQRDATIEELRAERRRLRQALGTVMEGMAHLVADE